MGENAWVLERRRVLIRILRPAAALGILAAVLFSPSMARGQDLQSGAQLNLEWVADSSNPVESLPFLLLASTSLLLS